MKYLTLFCIAAAIIPAADAGILMPEIAISRTRSRGVSMERLCELPLLGPGKVGSVNQFQRKVQDPKLDVLMAKDENVEISIHSKSSTPGQASGDIHRVVKAGPDRLLVFIGDISGHGNPVSGSLGLAVQSVLSDFENAKIFEALASPIEILRHLDKRMDAAEIGHRLELLNASFSFVKKIKSSLKKDNPARKYNAKKIIERMLEEYQVGLGVLELNMAAGKAVYSEGGLFGMVHVKKDGTIAHLRTDNGFIGSFSSPFNLGSFNSASEIEIQLSKGDMLVLASDGFFEAPYDGPVKNEYVNWNQGRHQVHWNLEAVIAEAMPEDHSPETFARNLKKAAKSATDDTTIIVIPIK